MHLNKVYQYISEWLKFYNCFTMYFVTIIVFEALKLKY